MLLVMTKSIDLEIISQSNVASLFTPAVSSAKFATTVSSAAESSSLVHNN